MPDSMDALRTALADRYTLDREIGRGGMATVYLAEDLKHQRKVAIKVLHPELAAVLGPDRFLREIQIAAQLQHPHILTLIDSGQAGGFLYYVMPYVKGESLRDRLTREHELPVGEAVRILREVVDALAHAHEQGLVHRDIKPENVMLSGRHAMVMDFGVAKAISEATGRQQLTTAGVALGTPAYMAPEQAAADPHLDHRVDIYAVGVLAYELLTGRAPFTGPSVQAILAAQVMERPDHVTKHREAVPPALATVVMKCLEKKPADRWQSADELLDHLEPLATPGTGTTPVATQPVAATTARPARWRGPAIAVILALAVVSGWLAFSSARSGGRSAPPAPPAIPRIVVLPFDNLGRPEDQYFADGLTEEITAKLGTFPGLGVISRTSAMQYRSHTKALKQIAQELNVGYVLESSVRWEKRTGGTNRVRVTSQLIRATDDTHLWAEQFDTAYAEVFGVQTAIATKVAQAMNVTLLGGAPAPSALDAPPTRNLDAYDYYLRGNAYFSRGFAQADLRAAVAMYEHAIALDRNFALAYAKLARVHDGLYWFSYDQTEARSEQARKAAEQALRLSPDLPEGHLALGIYLYHGKRAYARALEEYAIAQRGQPNNADVLFFLGAVERRLGKWEQAASTMERAMAADRRAYPIAWDGGGITNLKMRRYAQAEQSLDLAISISPDQPDGYALKSALYFLQGDAQRARQALEEGFAKAGPGPMAWELVSQSSPLGNGVLRYFAADFETRLGQITDSSFGARESFYIFAAMVHSSTNRLAQARLSWDSARITLEKKLRTPGCERVTWRPRHSRYPMTPFLVRISSSMWPRPRSWSGNTSERSTI